MISRTLIKAVMLFGAAVVGSAHFTEAAPFEQVCQGNGFEIQVSSDNASAGANVRIVPKGLAKVNEVLEFQSESPLSGVLFEDMNGDNIEEIVLVFRAAGSGSYGTVRAFSTNGAKSLTEIVIAEPSPSDLTGYMGHDEFQIMENTFVRRFPVYKPGDSNAKPTGGMRQIQYKLLPGEASWHLRIDRVVSF